MGDKSQTVVETGLYNLTKDEAPALLHFGTEKTQQWLLVRLADLDAVDSDASSEQEPSRTAAPFE